MIEESGYQNLVVDLIREKRVNSFKFSFFIFLTVLFISSIGRNAYGSACYNVFLPSPKLDVVDRQSLQKEEIDLHRYVEGFPLGMLENIAMIKASSPKYVGLINILRVVTQGVDHIVNIFAKYDSNLDYIDVQNKMIEIKNVAGILDSHNISHLFSGFISNRNIKKFIRDNKEGAARELYEDEIGFTTVQKDLSADFLIWEVDRKGRAPDFVYHWDVKTYASIVQQIAKIEDVFRRYHLIGENLGLVIDEFGKVFISRIENIEFSKTTTISPIKSVLSQEIKKITDVWNQQPTPPRLNRGT